MKEFTILVTGVGAIIGYGVIRSLRSMSYPVRIVGIDIYPDAVGQHWCDIFERAVYSNSQDYPGFIRKIVLKYKINLVIPGIEQDVVRLSEIKDSLRDTGVIFALNDADLIKTANDKWLMHNKLIENGFPCIQTYIDGEFGELAERLGIPFLLKPRCSYASKGIQQIADEVDFIYWRRKLGVNFMVQEIVGDLESEYTVGVFGFGDGSCAKKIIFQRKLSGEGATVKAKVRVIPELDSLIDRYVKLLCPIGPTNFQFRQHRGVFLLLEVNPRISSSTSLRTAFGYNEARMCLDYYLEGKRPEVGDVRSGFAVRYIDEVVIYDRDYF